MKKVRRIGVIAALITMLSMSVIMQGCKKKYQEIALYKYTENTDGTLTITELTDKGKSEYELSVPSELDGKKVSAIGDSAFKDDVIIKSVDIADGIEYIGSSAFLSCYNLENISIPQTVTDIGSHAFTETAWVEKQFASSSDIIINNILYQAEDDAEDYVVKDGVVTIASGVFYNNTTIKSVTLPSSVKNIGTNAFAGCTNLTEINLPDGLESIGYGAFADSGLDTIRVPKSVKSIGADAFLGIDTVDKE